MTSFGIFDSQKLLLLIRSSKSSKSSLFTINSKLFCKECPFSLSIDHLNALFNTYYDKRSLDGDTKNLCYRRRCILDQENMDEKFPFVYLCNYNPLEEFSDNNIAGSSLTKEHISISFLFLTVIFSR